MVLHPTSLRVLSHLRSDARKPLSVIARYEGLSVSTVFFHSRLLDGNVISRYVSLVDHSLLGFPLRSFFLVSGDDSSLLSFFRSFFGVNSVFRLDNSLFLVDVFFRGVADYSFFSESLLSLSSSVFCFDVLEHVVVESFLSLV